LQSRVDYIGFARSPVLVVDDVWDSPEVLIAQAAAKQDYSALSLYYPGVRSSAPPAYALAMTQSLRSLIRETFDLAEDLTITDSTFSLVATPAERLVPFQRVPHFDSADPNRLALLHYLCGREHGGTSFYRHRGSGIECVSEANREQYIRTVNAEVKSLGTPPARFIEGDTELFERIARYDCTFNRAIVYRGSNLHSVNTPADYVPSLDPRSGRLTVNTFLLAGATLAGGATQSPDQ
jgi:hypothetical protein